MFGIFMPGIFFEFGVFKYASSVFFIKEKRKLLINKSKKNSNFVPLFFRVDFAC